MKINSKFITAVVATSIGLGAIGQVALADTGTSTNATTEVTKMTAGELAVPAIGVTLMTDVHKARVAMFDGQIDAASAVLAQATSYLGDDAAKFAIKLPGDSGYGLPVDGGLSFAEGFTPTQDHAGTINAAGELMQKGDQNAAIKMMTDAGIKLAMNVVVVPYKSTVDGLEKAVVDLDGGEIHSANMTLKSIETSPEVVSYAPDALPKQGYALDEIFQ
ncbi:YfdX family protein [Aliiroseovarius sp. 2305UL8-7]|uniref:YfdX family protein n=1 Tax=Aliiroseovarius conchicola TaxID=3121637 RepID=UPI00352863D0